MQQNLFSTSKSALIVVIKYKVCYILVKMLCGSGVKLPLYNTSDIWFVLSLITVTGNLLGLMHKLSSITVLLHSEKLKLISIYVCAKHIELFVYYC